MYAVAQRVRSRPPGEPGVGINSVRYRHEGGVPPGFDWQRPDLDVVSTAMPGQLVVQQLEIAPGGNDVLSYLDVAAAEGTEIDRIIDALDQERAALGELRSSVAAVPIAVRFEYLDARGAKGSLVDEFDELRRKLEVVLRAPDSDLSIPDPLVLMLRQESTGFVAELLQDSADRVRRAGGLTARVTIDYDVARDLQSLHPPFLLHLVAAATALDRDRLLALGGVRFVDESNRSVYEWPSGRGPARGARIQP